MLVEIIMEIKLGENILYLRRKQGLTQEQLAQLLNVSVGAVSKWENGNNRPDIELLPIIADVLQVSIDALMGYEKAYKNLEIILKQLDKLLLQEEYAEAESVALNCLRRYPNDFQLNKILADIYYSQCYSNNANQVNEKIHKSIYFYERCIELFASNLKTDVTEESLYIQIATLCMLDKNQLQRAVDIIEEYNGSGKYDNLLANCLYFMGEKEKAKKIILHHSVTNQIFCFNDFTTLADIFERENELKYSVMFLEAELACFKVFMNENGSYADRAYAGQAYIIAKIYIKLGNHEKGKQWIKTAKFYAEKYLKNPSMEISSMQFCENVKGRMIDNFAATIELLNNQTEDDLYENLTLTYN